jgi:transcriptional regulator with XRE-family HTH domain
MLVTIMSTLSERLKQARQYAGLTQEELSAKSGVTQASISKIELGKNKSENTTFGVQLAVACRVRCEWLVLAMGEMLDGLKPDEAALLEKYRDSDATGKTAIQRVAESLAHYDASASEKTDKAA